MENAQTNNARSRKQFRIAIVLFSIALFSICVQKLVWANSWYTIEWLRNLLFPIFILALISPAIIIVAIIALLHGFINKIVKS